MLSLSLLSLVSAQQPKSQDELRANLNRAIQERNGPHALVAMLDLDQFYVAHRYWDKHAEILKQIIYYWSTKIAADSIGVARYSADLAEALERAGDTTEAEKDVHFAMAIFEKNGPRYEAANVRTERILYAILRKENRLDEAAALESRLAPQHRPEHWDKHPGVLSKREPEYTNAAREKRISGDISLSLIVDEDGKAKDIEVIAPLGFGLDENAIKAVKKWKFSPAVAKGLPIRTYATIYVSFRLL